MIVRFQRELTSGAATVKSQIEIEAFAEENLVMDDGLAGFILRLLQEGTQETEITLEHS